MTSPPAGVSTVEFPSGDLRLKAWVNAPRADHAKKRPAVVFLHGGFGFGKEDWDMTKPYRDAGFAVLAPMLRGENGQAGVYTLFYDEVDDVLAAGEYLRKQPYVDGERLFVAGHSVGGTLAPCRSGIEPIPGSGVVLSLSGPDSLLPVRDCEGIDPLRNHGTPRTGSAVAASLRQEFQVSHANLLRDEREAL